MIKVDKGHVEIDNPTSSKTGAEMCSLFVALNNLFDEYPEIAESVCYAFIGVGQTKQLIGFIEKMADALEVASKEALNDKIR